MVRVLDVVQTARGRDERAALLTIGCSTNERLCHIDHAFDADKIDASRNVRHLVVIVVVPRGKRDGIDRTRQEGRAIRQSRIRNGFGSDSYGGSYTIDSCASCLVRSAFDEEFAFAKTSDHLEVERRRA
jgi:hypothetical protein